MNERHTGNSLVHLRFLFDGTAEHSADFSLLFFLYSKEGTTQLDRTRVLLSTTFKGLPSGSLKEAKGFFFFAFPKLLICLRTRPAPGQALIKIYFVLRESPRIQLIIKVSINMRYVILFASVIHFQLTLMMKTAALPLAFRGSSAYVRRARVP